MIKLLTAAQIRELDRYTIENEPITSIDLMERAGQKCVDWLQKNSFISSEQKHFVIFCGNGNNGGDGLVIARKLIAANQKVDVFILELSKKPSPDFASNLKRLACKPTFLKSDLDFFESFEEVIVIDCIFGTGLNREADDFTAAVIDKINAVKQLVISIDIPSGLFADRGVLSKKQAIVKANYTLSFQFPKQAFLFPECSYFVGNWIVLDIGLHQQFIQELKTNYFLITHSDAASFLRPRDRFAHKGNFGKALLFAGSKGKAGAAVLAAKACLRSGVGLLTLQVPECATNILQITVPEAMVEADREMNFLSELKQDLTHTALGIGPGIGMEKQTQNLLKMLIQQSNAPMVIDADALNALAENKTWLSFLPPGSILTPHIGEFKRLIGNFDTTEERLEMQLEFSKKYKVCLVVKGKYTCITSPNACMYFNTSGNPGMASGGSGDALTGIILGLLAQKYAPEQAAILGVYLHGLAGDIAAEKQGEEALLPSDLIESISEAYKGLIG